MRYAQRRMVSTIVAIHYYIQDIGEFAGISTSAGLDAINEIGEM